jgi:predicted lipase
MWIMDYIASGFKRKNVFVFQFPHTSSYWLYVPCIFEYQYVSLCDLAKKRIIVSSFRITLETEFVNKGGEFLERQTFKLRVKLWKDTAVIIISELIHLT